MTKRPDLTKQEFNIFDELEFTEDGIEAAYELWFDTASVFGVDTQESGETWLNFYTTWLPNGGIIAQCTVNTDSQSESYVYALTREEKDFFRQKMEAYSRQKYGKSLMELWEEQK